MVQLSNYEWKIMNLIWDEQPRTITQLTKALAEETGWSKHTVITYLKRLESKGAVHYEEGAKAKLYYADIKRTDAQLQEVDSFLNKVFSGSLGLMVKTMIKDEKLSDEDIDELVNILKNS
ncbi:MAG: BlaI/MecI/CopY family transcriptional regulator [Lachnospiraceae bacterium]|nr:BlaI/MecI/CopY family transcriptional regulator [Lachnospiraceae bacterium]NBH24889.1 BlaI/MecI/CopY family transcriptional regulator [Lachnospiraceae bacterium]GFI16482.1 penicillinase repressor [Lachnospiraceae bacterium]